MAGGVLLLVGVVTMMRNSAVVCKEGKVLIFNKMHDCIKLQTAIAINNTQHVYFEYRIYHKAHFYQGCFHDHFSSMLAMDASLFTSYVY